MENAEEDWAHDPQNPRNWSKGRKWRMVAAVSFYTFVTPLGSSMMAPALPYIAEHFAITSETIVALTLSIFLLSFAISPLIWAPLSEIYGRLWILHINNLLFLAFNLGCAFAPTTGALIGFRFLCGWVGAAPLAIGGGVIGDLFAARDRASAMAVYTLGPLIGPAVGPVIGGFVAQTIGWKYVFIIITATTGLAAVFGLPLLRETYAPIIRLRLSQSMDPAEAMRRHPHLLEEHGKDQWRHLAVNLARPFVMLAKSFVCFILSLYMALKYSIYYLMFATFPDLFSDVYHFTPGIAGLAYLGIGIGFVLATVIGGHVGNQLYRKSAERNGGKGEPEMRLPALIAGSFFVPVGLFWYGWSAQAQIHWIMPIIGTGIFGFGLMATFLPIQLYLVDAFRYAASALSAAAVARSMLGFAFPLFGSQMYAALGNGGGNSLLAGLAIVIGIPFPIWIYYRGAELRARSSLTQ
ncbi:MFS general substrate transporter [Auriscalpium vulgare]|uniref:MFS general substrate transporter n=1 Tax=Auriscalpium vulgare TaxID=40419 RepID=A0ACB8S9D5_9AGAM|nr:MFS general substrate transporter [Auriscalpium vulgare]